MAGLSDKTSPFLDEPSILGTKNRARSPVFVFATHTSIAQPPAQDSPVLCPSYSQNTSCICERPFRRHLPQVRCMFVALRDWSRRPRHLLDRATSNNRDNTIAGADSMEQRRFSHRASLAWSPWSLCSASLYPAARKPEPHSLPHRIPSRVVKSAITPTRTRLAHPPAPK